MSKDQVVFILNTFENFEPDAWNYFYQVTKGDEILAESKIKVQFDANGF